MFRVVIYNSFKVSNYNVVNVQGCHLQQLKTTQHCEVILEKHTAWGLNYYDKVVWSRRRDTIRPDERITTTKLCCLVVKIPSSLITESLRQSYVVTV